MSTLSVDTIQGKTTAGTVAMPSGSVVQVAQNVVLANGFSTASTSEVDVTNYFVDITPKFSDSIILFETVINGQVDVTNPYARFRVVDSNNSDTVIHARSYVAQYGYVNDIGTTAFNEIPIRAVDTNCGTTSTMRLQLQVKSTGGSMTFSMNWSSLEDRIITATEIKA